MLMGIAGNQLYRPLTSYDLLRFTSYFLPNHSVFMRKSLLFVLFLLTTFDIQASCRSYKVKHSFDIQNGYPKGRKGYVVDHVCALSCGGLDIISNMQYQTYEESKMKDKWETRPLGCAKTCNEKNSLPKRTVFNCR